MSHAVADPNQPVPTEYVLEDDPSVHVANIELGITFYLADSMHWAQTGAVQALQHFLRLAPREFLLWYTTSRLDRWNRVTDTTLHEVSDAFSVDWLGKIRHGFELVLSDDVTSESTGFRYVEVDEQRVLRSSLLELTLPAHFDPALLMQLADAVFSLGPIYAAIGGYALRYNTALKGSAFTAAHGWAKRYLGLDMQDRERMPWLVRDKLPGVSWLNYVGAPWLEANALDANTLLSHTFVEPVKVSREHGGLRIVAGDAPTLGDLNHFASLAAYEELAHALGEHFVSTPPPLYGEFVRQDDAGAWFRRLLEPGDWR